MAETIFYAWQSDLPNSTNRQFIREAIDDAIRALHAELGVEDAYRSDQDTEGVAGDIDVARVIFDKIAQCRIFVADVTTVSPADHSRKTPNPNVLIEYGRASVLPGSDAVVTVFNTAFGAWEHDRPFDMRTRRKPVTYHLARTVSNDEKRKVRASLGKELAAVFKHILSTPSTNVKTPIHRDFDFCRQRYREILPLDFTRGRLIGFWCGLIPLAHVPHIDNTTKDGALLERQSAVRLLWQSGEGVQLTTLDAHIDGLTSSHAPMHRGMSRQWRGVLRSSADPNRRVEILANCSVWSDGRACIAVRTNDIDEGPSLNVRYILAEAANALRLVDAIRKKVASPHVQFSVAVELRYDEQSADLFEPVRTGQYMLRPFSDEEDRTGVVRSAEPFSLGPYTVGSSDKFSQVLGELYQEIVTSMGQYPERGVQFKL